MPPGGKKKQNRRTYQEWERFVFDHPVAETLWWFAEGAPSWREEDRPRESIRFFTKLLKHPEDLPKRYTPEQIGQGLWYLLLDTNSAYVRLLRDQRVPLAERAGCIKSIESLYTGLFATLCPPLREEGGSGVHGEPDGICYMLWDLGLVDSAGGVAADEDALLDACVQVMRAALKMEHTLCQLSALHGLGHLHKRRPADVQRIVDAYQEKVRHPALAQYAQSVREGRVM